MIAGPAPGRAGSPAMAVPVVAKIPAPMVAPTPRAVRCHLLSERLRPPRSAMSFSQSAIDLRTNRPGMLSGERGEERIGLENGHSVLEGSGNRVAEIGRASCRE